MGVLEMVKLCISDSEMVGMRVADGRDVSEGEGNHERVLFGLSERDDVSDSAPDGESVPVDSDVGVTVELQEDLSDNVTDASLVSLPRLRDSDKVAF